MIHSSKGYMQGYIGMAVADSKERVIAGAKASGSANEGAHFPDMLKNALSNVEKAGVKKETGKKPVVMADSNANCIKCLRAVARPACLRKNA
jgi:flagellar hook-basal body complex protein FliE